MGQARKSVTVTVNKLAMKKPVIVPGVVSVTLSLSDKMPTPPPPVRSPVGYVQ